MIYLVIDWTGEGWIPRFLSAGFNFVTLMSVTCTLLKSSHFMLPYTLTMLHFKAKY